jgi:hypothetical protein
VGGVRARTVVLDVRAPLSPADADRLCEAVQQPAHDDDAVLVVCAVTGPADVGVVEALARVGLLARRAGLVVRVRCDSEPLRPLLHLCGLDEVLLSGDEPGTPAHVLRRPLARTRPVCQSPSRRPGRGQR